MSHTDKTEAVLRLPIPRMAIDQKEQVYTEQ